MTENEGNSTEQASRKRFQRRYSSLPPLFAKPPSASRSNHLRRHNLSTALRVPLDRVNVLGDEESGYGHTGCVNALSWTEDGSILLSGGDDTTVRIWKMDTSDNEQEYPLVCNSVIQTGHTQNIFSAQMLPYSERIATAAGDNQVRVFDVRTALAVDPVSDKNETVYSASQTSAIVLRCHEDRVKRIVTEDSPDIFLSVSEDGSVRQHDLRTRHRCRRHTECPPPLLQMDFVLTTLSVSPLTPFQLVVAGESPYGFLFDRRHMRENIYSRWGKVPRAGEGTITCVRRFGRDPALLDSRSRTRSPHVTGARLSRCNGHELLLSYSDDGVYLFSTLDSTASKEELEYAPSKEESAVSHKSPKPSSETHTDHDEGSEGEGPRSGSDSESEAQVIELDTFSDRAESKMYNDVPVVFPRRRFLGARNRETVKDVNFLGPHDEWVVSGSDDGNFFIWDKKTTEITGIYEGDGYVVNMVEGHPFLPIVAVSGIDKTVKVFAPNRSNAESQFDKTANAERIAEVNKTHRGGSRTMRVNLAALLSLAGQEGQVSGCTPQ